MNRVSILGIGWLGVQLAEVIRKDNFKVFGTVSSNEKAKNLSNEFVSIEKFDILDFNKSSASSFKFKKADYFVITIPPSAAENYSEILNELVEDLLQTNPQSRLIFISSISVYGDEHRSVNELSTVNPKTKNAIKLAEVENFLLNKYPNRTAVIRLGGLMGGNRHPINSLSGKKSIPKPYAAINLIHSYDVCKLVAKLLVLDSACGVYNLCCVEHPTKLDYYSWAADQLGVEKPHYNTVDNQKDKVVICDAVKKINFELKYKSPYDFTFIK